MQFGFHNNNKKNGFGLRYIILMVVVTAMFGALVLQLANLQLRNGQEYYDTAESRKMNAAMELDGLDLCKLLEVNDSATNMVHAVANLELVLKDKLEFISNNLYYPPAGTDTSSAC